MERDPRIDEKIAQAAPFARPILEHLRELVHRSVPGAGHALQPGAAPRPKPAIDVPADFASALALHPPAKAFFDGLAPSHRYEYLEWITGAKREETRARRIGEAVAMLAEGKRRNWKYER